MDTTIDCILLVALLSINLLLYVYGVIWIIFRYLGLSIDVGHIRVFLVWYVGVYQAVSQHIPCYGSNILSILGNCDPTNLLKLHNAFSRNLEDDLHNLW